MNLEVVSDVYRSVRKHLLDSKVELSSIGLQNCLLYRVINILIDFIDDLL